MPASPGIWLLLAVLAILILLVFFIRTPDTTIPPTIADRDLD